MKDTALSLIRGLPIGAVRQESILFYLKLGYWPDLVSPKTYNEKLNFRKLFVQVRWLSWRSQVSEDLS